MARKQARDVGNGHEETVWWMAVKGLGIQDGDGVVWRWREGCGFTPGLGWA